MFILIKKSYKSRNPKLQTANSSERILQQSYYFLKLLGVPGEAFGRRLLPQNVRQKLRILRIPNQILPEVKVNSSRPITSLYKRKLRGQLFLSIFFTPLFYGKTFIIGDQQTFIGCMFTRTAVTNNAFEIYRNVSYCCPRKQKTWRQYSLRKQTFRLAHHCWGTFREEERLRLSDRNSILMT